MALDFPSNPTNGQTYNGYVYSTSIGAWQAKPAAQSPFYTSDTPPANPITGDSWFNTNDGTMYIYMYDGNTSQWVEHRSQIAKSQVGLVPVTPVSVAVGSGTATVNATGTVTFTGASSVSLNGCFTSTYTNYKILFTGSTSATCVAQLVLRSAGTNATTGYYLQGVKIVGGASPSNYSTANASFWYLNEAATSDYYSTAELSKPYLSLQTKGSWQSYGYSGGEMCTMGTLGTAQSTSYDGFSVVFSSGTATGTVQVFGYNQ